MRKRVEQVSQAYEREVMTQSNKKYQNITINSSSTGGIKLYHVARTSGIQARERDHRQPKVNDNNQTMKEKTELAMRKRTRGTRRHTKGKWAAESNKNSQ